MDSQESKETLVWREKGYAPKTPVDRELQICMWFSIWLHWFISTAHWDWLCITRERWACPAREERTVLRGRRVALDPLVKLVLSACWGRRLVWCKFDCCIIYYLSYVWFSWFLWVISGISWSIPDIESPDWKSIFSVQIIECHGYLLFIVNFTFHLSKCRIYN